MAGTSAVAGATRIADPTDAIGDYGPLIEHWRRAGAWNQQWTTIRALLSTFARLGCDQTAAVLHGALTASSTAGPVFGAEAAQLAEAVAIVCARLGQEQFSELVAEGAAMGDSRAVNLPLVALRQVETSAAGAFVFEQQAYYDIAGGLISRLQLVCSGDRPVEPL